MGETPAQGRSEPAQDPVAAGAPARTRLPPAIWALGFVSLLMDVSSEMIHSLLPVFPVSYTHLTLPTN